MLRREAARVRVAHAVERARRRRPADVVRRLDSAFDGRGRQERDRRVFDVEGRRQKGRQDVLADRQRRQRVVLVVAEERAVFVLERGSTRADAALRELQGMRQSVAAGRESSQSSRLTLHCRTNERER